MPTSRSSARRASGALPSRQARRRAEREAAAQPAVPRRPRRAMLLGGIGLGGAAAAVAFALLGGGARPQFDQKAAFQHLKKQVQLGPRVPNRPGHTRCREYLVSTLRGYADNVETQDFSQTLGKETLRMSNIIARFKGTGASTNGVMLSAHWDTRPTADQEPDPRQRKKPIPGANDGASGVAVLLEAARIFKQAPPPVPVMIVLVDGEDYGPETDRMFLGSRYFINHLPPDVPRRGILLDMIGDKDLEIPQEGYSVEAAPEIVSEVYAAARKLGYRKEFPNRRGGFVTDDHVMFIGAGLKIIDLIDFEYGRGNAWWHTHDDTPDKCSPKSLGTVGDVVLEWVYSQK